MRQSHLQNQGSKIAAHRIVARPINFWVILVKLCTNPLPFHLNAIAPGKIPNLTTHYRLLHLICYYILVQCFLLFTVRKSWPNLF